MDIEFGWWGMSTEDHGAWGVVDNGWGDAAVGWGDIPNDWGEGAWGNAQVNGGWPANNGADVGWGNANAGGDGQAELDEDDVQVPAIAVVTPPVSTSAYQC